MRFDGFSFGNITPSDLDSFVEFRDEAWVWMEAKTGDKPVPYGQRLAFERFVKDMRKANKHSIAMIVEHNTSPSEDPLLAECVVREFYSTETMKWRKPRERLTAFEAANRYLTWAEEQIKHWKEEGQNAD